MSDFCFICIGDLGLYIGVAGACVTVLTIKGLGQNSGCYNNLKGKMIIFWWVPYVNRQFKLSNGIDCLSR